MRIALLIANILLAGLAFSQTAELSTETPADIQAIREEILRGDAPPATSSQPPANPKQEVQEILSNPLYRDSVQESVGESWIERAMRNFNEWLQNLLNNQDRQQENRGNPSLFQAAGGLIQLVIYALIAALIGFLIFMLAKIRFAKRKASEDDAGLLSDEEVGRSADQWLTEADRLSKNGEFRAAIRCLYLACLTRLDENRILRFERHETNWEHLYRFRDLPSKPGEFDLTASTQKFDHAWYGLVPQTMDDVAWFKTEYQSLLRGIKEAKS